MNSLDFVLLLLFISSAKLLDHCYCLDYSDIEGLGLEGCRAKLSCKDYKGGNTFKDKNCECDPYCTSYNDCCIDPKKSNRRPTGGQRPTSSSIIDRTCLPYGGHKHLGVYVVSSCARRWRGPRELRLKCEDSLDFSDPMNAAPLTSLAQKRTYRNRYCSECNGVTSENLIAWPIKLDCESYNPQNVSNLNDLNNLEWNEEKKEWRIYRTGSSGERIFHSCIVNFGLPPNATDSVRYCRANLISSCKKNWTRRSVKEACESYTGVVYSGAYLYRNPHCALCNGRTVDQISCEGSLTSKKTHFSLGCLLDVNQCDGKSASLTQVPQCASNQIYDPFFKKCRPRTCSFPGYKLQNDRCVKG